MTNSTDIDITNAADIAGHIWQQVEDAERDITRHSEGTSYTVTRGAVRVAIGDDPIESEGITWALYSTDDAFETLDPYTQGGWAFGDSATAELEIADIIGELRAAVVP